MRDIDNKKFREIDIKAIYNVIRKRVWILIIMTVLAGIAGEFYARFLETPLYQSSTRIILRADAQTMPTLKVIVREPVVLEKVIAELDLLKTPDSLRGQISVDNVEASQVTVISVVDKDPKLAAAIVNSVAKVFKEQVFNLYQFNDVTILSEAKENPWPINQNHNKTILIAIILGVFISLGLIFLLDSLDDTLKNEREIEQLLDLPVLGSISKMTSKNTSRKKSHLQTSTEIRGESIGS
jgi:capsular polysaccharide biosynthesis protein